MANIIEIEGGTVTEAEARAAQTAAENEAAREAAAREAMTTKMQEAEARAQAAQQEAEAMHAAQAAAEAAGAAQPASRAAAGEITVIATVKVSELPIAASADGFYALGVTEVDDSARIALGPIAADAAAAKAVAEAAQADATNAKSDAKSAKLSATNAQTAATNAQGVANAAKTAADAAQEAADAAGTAAATAQATANGAKDAADAAQAAANAAQTTADEANTKAGQASAKASSALTTATAAQEAADAAGTAAEAAQTTADEAATAAAAAQTTANTAKSNATAAKSAAEAAQSVADEALELARKANEATVTGFIPTGKNSTGYFTGSTTSGQTTRSVELSFTTADDVTTNQYVFGDGTSTSACINVRITGARLMIAGNVITTMQVWPKTQYHVVVTHAASSITVFINGSTMQTFTRSLTAYSRISVGSFNTATSVFKGTIHHARLFHGAMTEAQYELLWNNGRPAQYYPYAPDFNGTLAVRYEPKNISGDTWLSAGAVPLSLTYTKVAGSTSTPTLDRSVTPDLTTMRMEQIVTTDISSMVAQIQTYYPRFFPERIFVQNLMTTTATGVALTYNVGTSIRATIGTLPAGYTAQSTPVVLYRDTDTMMKINAVATGVSSPGLRFIVYLKYMD